MANGTSRPVYLLLWVGDILIFTPDRDACDAMKEKLRNKYKRIWGHLLLFVGIDIVRDRNKRQITPHHHWYIKSVLEVYNMHDANGLSTPLDPDIKLSMRKDSENEKGTDIGEDQRRVGKLMYAMLGIRPDVAYAVSILGRFSSDPSG